MKRTLMLTLTAVLVISTAHLGRAADTWKAGVAKTVITPSQRMWMSGYASRDRPAEGTLHDLWAKALVIEDANANRAVLVTLDLVGISGELSSTIRDRIQDRYGLTRSQIALATSHTHSGPIVGGLTRFIYFLDDDQNKLVDEYAQFLSDRIVAVVGEALTDIAPATLQHGMGTATFAVNRRNNLEADVPQLRKDNELQGPFDHELPVLAVRREGELHAIVFGYACHSTVLSSYQWSGDWPGFAQLEIERRHPGATAMFWAGCGADQKPVAAPHCRTRGRLRQADGHGGRRSVVPRNANGQRPPDHKVQGDRTGLRYVTHARPTAGGHQFKEPLRGGAGPTATRTPGPRPTACRALTRIPCKCGRSATTSAS